MTPDEVRDQIRRHAGVKRHQIPVRVVEHTRMLAPRVIYTKRNKRRDSREVVVSWDWLQQRAPKLWAAIVADRILGIPERLTITQFKEEKE